MGRIESLWQTSATRRTALERLSAFAAAPPQRRGQDPFRDHSRVPAMTELRNALDFEAVAYEKLPRDAYNYTALGVEDEATLRRNRQAFDWVQLVPKGVVDVSALQPATDLLGTKMSFPIMIAPTASHFSLHPEGELGTHQAATAAADTPYIISHNASFPVAKIAAAATGPIWFQLYPRRTMEQNEDYIARAEDNGCKAIVVTNDGGATRGSVARYPSRSGARERALHDRHLGSRRQQDDLAQGGTRNPEPVAGTASAPAEPAAGLDWKRMEEIRAVTQVPLVVKGILTGEDAKACVEHGINGVIVSNHGGRSTDYFPSTLEVLAEVVDAVQGRIPVLIDGGFRSGSDILKALALGAKAVCLGRVPRWGLGAYGPPGMTRILQIMQGELLLAMAATGRPTLDSIDRTLVRTDFP
jgi:4-hydroxymandelate oxidase